MMEKFQNLIPIHAESLITNLNLWSQCTKKLEFVLFKLFIYSNKVLCFFKLHNSLDVCSRVLLCSCVCVDGRGCDWYREQQTGRQRARLDCNGACVIMVHHSPHHHLYLYGCKYTAASEPFSLRIPVHQGFFGGGVNI